MANTESTAVTAFINTVRSQLEDGYLPPQQKPLQKPPAIPTRRPQATPQAQPVAAGTPAPVMAEARQARGTMPPPIPEDAVARADIDPSSLPPLPQARPAAAAAPPPFAAPKVRAKSELIVPPHIDGNNFDDTTPLPKMTLDMQVEDSWFDSAPTPTDEHGLEIDFDEDSADFLSPVEMVEMDLDRPVKRKWGLIGAGALVLAGGIGIAAYIAMSGPEVHEATTASAASAARPAAATQKKAAAAPAPMATRAQPAATAAPAADPVDVPEGGVVLARAHFASEPAGATVTLVMNGKPVVLGKAPVDAQLDPNKTYQAMFTMPGHPTVLRDITFDGSEEVAIAADLDSPAPAAAPAVAAVAPIADEPAADETTADQPADEPAAEPAPAPRRHHAKKSHHRSKSRAARRSHRSTSRKATREVASRSKNSGILMINSKPPCDIVVDGRSTGKKTPAPRLSLSAGKHTITLINRSYDIKKSFKVTIRAGAKTRVLKDMTDRIH